MQTITVRDRQCFLDLAMQYAGDASAAVQMAFDNLLPVTQIFTPGTTLPFPVVVDAEITTVFKTEKAIPASSKSTFSGGGGGGGGEGIGFWIISNDFIVQ